MQVHPDDDAAREIGQPCGKTECWYVAHAESGAEIGLGLKQGATRAEFERSIRENRAEELLNWIKVSAGDMIYVAAARCTRSAPARSSLKRNSSPIQRFAFTTTAARENCT